MWEIVGGMRVVHWRFRAGDGAIACSRWRLLPSGLPGAYVGKMVLESEGERAPVFALEVDYEGNPPRLVAPRARAGKDALALDCEEGESGGWFLSEDACLDAAAEPPIAPAGCVGSLAPPARERAQRVLAGGPRDALLELLRTKQKLWMHEACAPYIVRKTKDVITLYPTFSDYPVEVRPVGRPGLHVTETTEPNPYLVNDGRERIGLGCCWGETYDVLDASAERAILRARPDPRAASKPSAARDTPWYFSKAACDKARPKPGAAQ